MTLPNFFIVGAAKAGTTSFFEYLAQHPQVYVPFCKEPHYFSRAPHPAIAKNDAEYEKLFAESAGSKAVGEASVTYLADPEAAGRIHRLIPGARIIVFLRHPVKRAYSAWWQMYNLGYENLPFEDALDKEQERFDSASFRGTCPVHYTFYLYFRNGCYAPAVQRYVDLFGRDMVKVYIFEQAVSRLEETCRDLFSFLDIDSRFKPDLKVHNASQVARNRTMQQLLADPPGILKRGFDAMPIQMRRALYKPLKALYWFNTKKAERPVMDGAVKQNLAQQYKPHIHDVEELLKLDLHDWYTV